MDRIDIVLWDALRESAWDTLLLGNGASIAIHKEFAYPTLHGIADAKGLLATTAPIFAKLGTTDFEHVLLACWDAEHVNRALGTPSAAISVAYEEVRIALIEAVHSVHPVHADVAADLQRVGAFASVFPTVVSLNYDITLYWAMLLFNAANGSWFKDAFHDGEFQTDWEYLRRPYGHAAGATLAFSSAAQTRPIASIWNPASPTSCRKKPSADSTPTPAGGWPTSACATRKSRNGARPARLRWHRARCWCANGATAITASWSPLTAPSTTRASSSKACPPWPATSRARRGRGRCSLACAAAGRIHWQQLLDSGEFESGAAIARAEGLHSSTVNELLRLTLLAPDIVELLMAGRQPRRLTLIWFQRNPIPVDWQQQRQIIQSFE